jgi:hypothetical protein
MRFWILASSALLLAACEGEVTDGGTGSDTDFEALDEQAEGDGMTEAEEARAADPTAGGGEDPAPRAGDYPRPGEETTANPIEPGVEEPGGKDMLLEDEAEEIAEDGAEAYDDEDEMEGEDPPRR